MTGEKTVNGAALLPTISPAGRAAYRSGNPRGRIILPNWIKRGVRYRGLFPAYCVYLLAIFLYAHVSNLEVGRNEVGLGRALFTRIYLPDSDLYELAPIDETLAPHWLSSLSEGGVVPGDPNVYWISRFAHGLHGAGIEPIYMNALLVLIATLATSSVLARLGLPRWPSLALFLLNPATIYYSQTATKEIILLALTAMLGFSFCIERPGRRSMLMIPLVTIAIMIRAHEGFALLIASVGSLLPIRITRRAFQFGLLLLCLILPTLYDSQLIDSSAADSYREAAPSVTGLAQSIDFGLRHIPLFGYIGLPIRMFQNIVEPFPNFKLQDIYGPRSINTYNLVLVGSFYVTAYAFLRLCGELVKVLFVKASPGPRDQMIFLVASQLVVVAVNPFCHNRYVFNLIPLLGLAPKSPRWSDRSIAFLSWRRTPQFIWWCIAPAYGVFVVYQCFVS